MTHILGLDISTSVIGMAIMDMDYKLIHYRNLKMNSKDELEIRCWQFKQELLEVFENYSFDMVYVEQPAMMFGGGATTAQTMSRLQRFNGMCCYAVYTETMLIPELVHVNSARKKMNISIPKIVKNKKHHIINEVQKRYPNFTFEVTKQGNPKPGTDDIADAIVIAYYGVSISKEGLNDIGEDKVSK
jgi:Holliday junction resolvasome RuvABC endonuclease subunit